MEGSTIAGRVRVVVIIALPHSGSHLLSQLLSAHSRCVSIGELHNYDKFLHRPGSGNVIANYTEDALFSGLDRAPENRWHELIMSNARQRYPVATTLIDNSKRVEWCRRLTGNPQLQVIPVLLLRDPRALIRYWKLRYDSRRKIRRQRIRHARMAPWQAPAFFICPPLELYIRKWLLRSQEATRLLTRTGHRDNVVTYHDLATRPVQTLQRLMPLLDLEYEPDQLQFGDVQQHGTVKAEYRQASQRSQLELDVRWQSDLDLEEIRVISEDTRIAVFLDGLGLAMTDSGLSSFR